MKLAKEEDEIRTYFSDMSYEHIREQLGWVRVYEVKENHISEYMDIEIPETYLDLKRFVQDKLKQEQLIIEVKRLPEQEIFRIINSIIIKSLYASEKDSIVIKSGVDINKLVNRFRLLPKGIGDNVIEYNIYFNLHGIVCRFHYDTRCYLLEELDEMERVIYRNLINLSYNDRELLKRELERE